MVVLTLINPNHHNGRPSNPSQAGQHARSPTTERAARTANETVAMIDDR